MSNVKPKKNISSSLRRYSNHNNKKLYELFELHKEEIDIELSRIPLPTLEKTWNTLTLENKCNEIINFSKLFFFNSEFNNKNIKFGYLLENHCFDTALIFSLLVDKLRIEYPDILDSTENKYIFSDEFLPYLITCVYIHDIGKLIPAFVRNIIQSDIHFCDLDKKTAKKYILGARLHTLVGEYIAKRAGFDEFLTNIIKSHHEKFDGSGYPEGITYVPLYLSILSGADTISSITSPDKIDQERITTIEELIQKFDKILGNRKENLISNLIMEILDSVVKINDNSKLPNFGELTKRMRELRYQSQVINSSIILQKLFKVHETQTLNNIINEVNILKIIEIKEEDV